MRHPAAAAALLAALLALSPLSLSAQVTAIRAGRLLDPDKGTISTNQVILVEKGKFTAVGADVAIPRDATVIDLSDLTVMPGLVDTHNHLAITYKEEPESNVYYFTYVMDPTPLRAIQAASARRPSSAQSPGSIWRRSGACPRSRPGAASMER